MGFKFEGGEAKKCEEEGKTQTLFQIADFCLGKLIFSEVAHNGDRSSGNNEKGARECRVHLQTEIEFMNEIFKQI